MPFASSQLPESAVRNWFLPASSSSSACMANICVHRRPTFRCSSTFCTSANRWYSGCAYAYHRHAWDGEPVWGGQTLEVITGKKVRRNYSLHYNMKRLQLELQYKTKAITTGSTGQSRHNFQHRKKPSQLAAQDKATRTGSTGQSHHNWQHRTKKPQLAAHDNAITTGITGQRNLNWHHRTKPSQLEVRDEEIL